MSNIPTSDTTHDVSTAPARTRVGGRRALVGGAVATGIAVAAIVALMTRENDVSEPAAVIESSAVDTAPPVSEPTEPERAPAPLDDEADARSDETGRSDPVEEEPIEVAQDAGDLLVDDLDDGLDDGATAESSPALPGLRQLCFNTVHGDSSSGIWVRGEVYGLDGGYIFVQGATINEGEEVQIPVSDGAFEGPLPIRQFGDHPLDVFSLSDAPDGERTDVLPTLQDGPGDTIPVDADDGPNFDSECFDFDPVIVGAETPGGVDDLAVGAIDELDQLDDADGLPDGEVIGSVDPERIVRDFFDGFVDQHRAGDAAGLLESLHPSARISYGEQVCSEYVDRTTGSIAGAEILDVSVPQELTLRTPNGDLVFPEAIPFTVEFELVDGSTLLNDGHLPVNDGEAHWLTMCGVEVP